MGAQSFGQGLFHMLPGDAEHPKDLSESHCLQVSKEEKEEDSIQGAVNLTPNNSYRNS